jgi:hypothetical protein
MKSPVTRRSSAQTAQDQHGSPSATSQNLANIEPLNWSRKAEGGGSPKASCCEETRRVAFSGSSSPGFTSSPRRYGLLQRVVAEGIMAALLVDTRQSR